MRTTFQQLKRQHKYTKLPWGGSYTRTHLRDLPEHFCAQLAAVLHKEFDNALGCPGQLRQAWHDLTIQATHDLTEQSALIRRKRVQNLHSIQTVIKASADSKVACA